MLIGKLTDKVEELKIQLKERYAQQFVTEAWMKGIGIQLAQIVEESLKLKAQLVDRGEPPMDLGSLSHLDFDGRY